jgi:hypothetical protein
VVPVLTGLVLGIVIGLAIGPLIRSWLAWREYLDASREARLHEDVLRLMSCSTDGTVGDSLGPVGTR